MSTLRDALTLLVTPDDVERFAAALRDRALAGDAAAISLIREELVRPDPEALDAEDRVIVRVLANLRATEGEPRKQGECRRLSGLSYRDFHRSIEKLKRQGIAEGRQGPAGGYYLTSLGAELATEISVIIP